MRLSKQEEISIIILSVVSTEGSTALESSYFQYPSAPSYSVIIIWKVNVNLVALYSTTPIKNRTNPIARYFKFCPKRINRVGSTDSISNPSPGSGVVPRPFLLAGAVTSYAIKAVRGDHRASGKHLWFWSIFFRFYGYCYYRPLIFCGFWGLPSLVFGCRISVKY